MGLHHRRQSARTVSDNPGCAANHDKTEKRLDHQRLILDRARRLREFHRLRDVKMGAGRIYPNPRGGSSIESYSGQFRRARLRRHQAHRLSRQQT